MSRSIRSAIRQRTLARSFADILFRHGPASKAWRAAPTALSTSPTPACAIFATSASVAGLMVGATSPPCASTKSPLMKSFGAGTAAVVTAPLLGGAFGALLGQVFALAAARRLDQRDRDH